MSGLRTVQVSIDDALMAALRPGKTLRVKGRTGGLWHIRALVDDYVVYRVWHRRPGRWAYHVEDVYTVELLRRDGMVEF